MINLTTFSKDRTSRAERAQHHGRIRGRIPPVRRVDAAVLRCQSTPSARVVCAPVMGAGALASAGRDRCQPEVNSDLSTETSLQQNRIQPTASHRSTGIPTVIRKAFSETSFDSSSCSMRHERNVDPATSLRSSSSSRCSRV